MKRSKIKRARMILDLKQNKVAKDLGIAASRLCRIEKGMDIESEELITKFSVVYGINIKKKLKNIPGKKKVELKRHTFILDKTDIFKVKKISEDSGESLTATMSKIIGAYEE